MRISKAISIVETFAGDEKLLIKRNNVEELKRISQEFNDKLPRDLKDYIQYYANSNDICYETVGNPLRLYGLDNLKIKQDGYSYNTITKLVIEGWSEDWFIIADEGADPIIIDLNSETFEIVRLTHGNGDWDEKETISDSIGQFILCSTALNYALNHFESEPIIDNENGFCLAQNSSEWYFTHMKEWAGKYYETWCGIFDNY